MIDNAMHLTIDGFGGDWDYLRKEDSVTEFLAFTPDKIGMTKISDPFVMPYCGEEPEDWGISGFVLIAESHLSIHTYPMQGRVWVDIFSCKPFDIDAVENEVRIAFELDQVRSRILNRGQPFA